MSKLFEKAQQFGKSFMLPIAILPAAGLLLGIGGALSNPNTIKAYPVLDIALLQNIFILMSAAGNIVFQNLPVIFAVGVALGLAKSDKRHGWSSSNAWVFNYECINEWFVDNHRYIGERQLGRRRSKYGIGNTNCRNRCIWRYYHRYYDSFVT